MTETESNAYFSGYQAGLAAVFAEKEVLIRRIDELCEQVEHDRQTSLSRLERIDQLKDENARLRELVSDMVLNMGGCAMHGNPLRLREFGSRARELGIEVGE